MTGDYKGPFCFTGTLHEVTVDLSGELISDPRGGAEAAYGPPIATEPLTRPAVTGRQAK